MMSNKSMEGNMARMNQVPPAGKGKPAAMPTASRKPAVNPALGKLPEHAKAYGVRGTKPSTRKGK